MKIVIINPNSSPEMTEDIDTAARNYAAGEFEVITLPTPGAPVFIDSYEDAAVSVPGMINLVHRYQEEADAFIIACHGDPGIDVLKEISGKPVVGIGEASMKLATMLGHRFSVVTTSRQSIPGKEAVVHQYHLDEYLASVKAPLSESEALNDEAPFLEAARAAIEQDMAEVIVLGCAGLAGLDRSMSRKLGVPVLDGVVCALIIATGLVKAGLGISKAARYRGKTPL